MSAVIEARYDGAERGIAETTAMLTVLWHVVTNSDPLPEAAVADTLAVAIRALDQAGQDLSALSEVCA